jgi:hypothetical protein
MRVGHQVPQMCAGTVVMLVNKYLDSEFSCVILAGI